MGNSFSIKHGGSGTSGRLRALLSGDAGSLLKWTSLGGARSLWFPAIAIALGAGVYGATIGLWRSPLQGFYVALKFPLILFTTACFNAGLNGMLGQLYGLNVRFLDSFRLIFISFANAALVLGAFAPLTLFALWNAPSIDVAMGVDRPSYRAIQLMHVVVIAFAGIVANLNLLNGLVHLSGSRKTAMATLIAWLAGNLLLGGQLCWILRPFIGAPFLEVQFLRPDAFEGNFFETVVIALAKVFSS